MYGFYVISDILLSWCTCSIVLCGMYISQHIINKIFNIWFSLLGMNLTIMFKFSS